VLTKKLTLFSVSKDVNDDASKSMKMHCIYSGVSKGTFRVKARLNSKKSSL